jgi:hypothetical protein
MPTIHLINYLIPMSLPYHRACQPDGGKGVHVDVKGIVMLDGNMSRYTWRIHISDDIIKRKFPRTFKGHTFMLIA